MADPMNAVLDAVTPSADVAPVAQLSRVDNDTIATLFQTRAESSKRRAQDFYDIWKRNVDDRLGKPSADIYTGGINIEATLKTPLNPNWPMNKTKTANLFSQVPTVQMTHENVAVMPAMAPFAKAVNYELGDRRAHIGVCMEECLSDVSNASGVAAAYCGYAARFRNKQIPAFDTSMLPPEDVAALQASGQLPMVDVPELVSDKYYGIRMSPTDFLWPVEFGGSNFDDADWVGRKFRMGWAEAKEEFDLSDDDKESVLGANERKPNETLRDPSEQKGLDDYKTVTGVEIYYWRWRVDPEELSFDCIWRIAFVDGKEGAAIHEPWKGQQKDAATGRYIGNLLFPIRALTLTYVSDHPIPPSDTEVIRPQVNDLNVSRSQMFQQRNSSMPLRWVNTSTCDPIILDLIMKGQWQGIIPSLGDGSRMFGEVARASYPSENFEFDNRTQADIANQVGLGPNQSGTVAPGDKTKAEVQIVQGNFATLIGHDRAKVSNFFLGIARTIAGYMALYSEFPMLTPDEKRVMQQAWDGKKFLIDLVMKIRPDSTVMIDTGARKQQLESLLNLVAKSPYATDVVKDIQAELLELNGFDPTKLKNPPPQAPEPPKMSFSFAGKDDLINPLVMATMIKEGVAPTQPMIDQAKQLLASVLAPVAPPAPPPMPPGGPMPGGGPPVGQPGQLPVPPQPPPQGIVHEQWNTMPTVNKRMERGPSS